MNKLFILIIGIVSPLFTFCQEISIYTSLNSGIYWQKGEGSNNLPLAGINKVSLSNTTFISAGASIEKTLNKWTPTIELMGQMLSNEVELEHFSGFKTASKNNYFNFVATPNIKYRMNNFGAGLYIPLWCNINHNFEKPGVAYTVGIADPNGNMQLEHKFVYGIGLGGHYYFGKRIRVGIRHYFPLKEQYEFSFVSTNYLFQTNLTFSYLVSSK